MSSDECASATPAARLESDPGPKLRLADPCIMVLFGATGDLVNRLVAPALYNLICSGQLPTNFALIGVARHESSVEGWRQRVHASLTDWAGADHLDATAWARLSDAMTFLQGDLSDPALYAALATRLKTVDAAERTDGNVIFYLAVEDRLFATAVRQLAAAKLTTSDAGSVGWRRVVIEKPFGHSLDSARALNAVLAHDLREDQIFRIDHFLGKDPVQNIMALRFANGLFEASWNRDHIDHVQITAAEAIGVGARGEFYERAGALRDMVPNHLLSLASLVAMEPPNPLEADSVRDRRADVLAAMTAARPDRAVRGQYSGGPAGPLTTQAYRDEPDVAAQSTVETYAALELEIDTWRWAGVPFFLRTGKRLSGRMTEIAICFKPAPTSVLERPAPRAPQPNWLILRIAPDETIRAQFEVKRPGPAMDLASAEMTFNYARMPQKQTDVGYETLLYDVMVGDPILFMRADMVEAGWRIVQPVLDAWASTPPSFPNYVAGEDGPTGARRLIARDGPRAWRPI